MSEGKKDIGKIMEEMLNRPLELIEENKKLKKKIDKLQKENEFLKAPFEYGDGNTLHKRYVEINFISKDKIRQLKKELEKKNENAIGYGYGFAIHYLDELLEE